MTLNKTHLKLAALLLDMASDKFGAHSCNDFEFPDSFTEEEQQQLLIEYNLYNCHHQINPGDEEWIDYPGDSGWMAFLANKFVNESGY